MFPETFSSYALRALSYILKNKISEFRNGVPSKWDASGCQQIVCFRFRWLVNIKRASRRLQLDSSCAIGMRSFLSLSSTFPILILPKQHHKFLEILIISCHLVVCGCTLFSSYLVLFANVWEVILYPITPERQCMVTCVTRKSLA